MEKEPNNKSVIRHYLLGDISDEQRQQVERRILADGEYLKQVSVLEDELVDEYVCGKLSPEDQQKFEDNFLPTLEGAEQVRLATGIRTYALKTRLAESRQVSAERIEPPLKRHGTFDYLRSRISVSRYALAVPVLLMLLVGSWLLVQFSQLKNQINQLRAESPAPTAREQELQGQLAEQQARNSKLAEDLKREQEQRTKLEEELTASRGAQKDTSAQNTLATILLTPGRVRESSGSNTLTLRPTVERVQFQMILRSGDYDSFKVSLKSGSGQEVWASGPLKAQSLGRRKAVQVRVPANLLSEGDFFLELQATTGDGNYEPAGNYYFRIVKG